MDLYDFKFTQNDLEQLIKNYKNYFAHLSTDESKKENLISHILLTQEYFFNLVETHGLKEIILRLIKNITKKEKLQKIIANLFVKSIAIHDFGKVNPSFQRKKMGNDIVTEIEHNLSSSHSIISAYIYVLYCELFIKDMLLQEEETFMDGIILAFSYPILMHHSSSLRCIKSVKKYNEHLTDLKKFVNNFSIFKDKKFIDEINKYVISNSSHIFSQMNNSVGDSFSLFALVKLLSSLLTASDYYATTHFMNDWQETLKDFGTLNSEIKNKIIRNIKNTKKYNKKIYENIKTYNGELPKIQSNENLNVLRQNIAKEVIIRLRKNINKNLFYIEAPTGSGKTNLSMLIWAEFLKSDRLNKITKIFYVFPFITLITQTFQAIQETLYLNQNEVVQIHSKSGFSEKIEDDFYGKDSKNVIDYLFVNYPISLISHIKFFDILKSNKKSANYLLHRLANSIVIIDELQTYPPSEWDKLVYFIVNYSKTFNIKFILMSATLPKIDNLLQGVKQQLDNYKFVSLIKNKEKYFLNPNFKNRVKINYELLSTNSKKTDKKEYLNNLWDKIIKESEAYLKEFNRVHTIIEFIYNKTAGEFIQLCKNKNNEFNFFDEIFLLSGTILEPRRKEIILKLKNKKYKTKKILLITTQVVEAGVDIDMDLGFKDISLVDSDEQLAGRINRNIKKSNCKLFLFDLDNAKNIYSKDYRYKLLNKLDEHKKILESKNFDFLYKKVMDYRNKINISSDIINIKDYLNHIKRLDFKEVDKNFKLINNITISVFVPIDIPVGIPDTNEKNFTEEEIIFLKNKNIILNNYVIGKRVWELYCQTIEEKNIDFFKNRKQQIIMQGLISKFTFYVMISSKNYEYLITSGNCEQIYGFLFLHNPNEIYSYEMGILTDKNQPAYFW